jgi:ABC-type glycerol-3-phosphate transport system substrate-binding protein
MKKVLSIIFFVSIVMTVLVGCSPAETIVEEETSEGEMQEEEPMEDTSPDEEEVADEAQPVEIEILLDEVEYQTQYEELLSVYTEEHPNVTFIISGWTEGQDAVNEARIAAGSPPHIWVNSALNAINKTRYDFLVNLLNVDYQYYDLYDFDVKTMWSEIMGVEEYLPVIPMYNPNVRSFIYHVDAMEKTGLNPKESVKTFEDLDAFLADLQAYVETTDEYTYALDFGWNANGFSTLFPTYLAASMSGGIENLDGVWNGTVEWTDVENNPYADAFAKIKEWYDKGYLPESFWTRQWEPDFEAGFIAEKSILAFHGPWLWDKVLAANPDANLDGFFLPQNDSTKILVDSFTPVEGVAIFNAYEGTEIYDTVLDVFYWLTSPEIVKYQSEIRSRVPLMDVSSVGQPEINSPQYLILVSPMKSGEFGDLSFDTVLWPNGKVDAYRVNGQPEVLKDDTMAAAWGDYLTGVTTLDEFLALLQARWEAAYDMP